MTSFPDDGPPVNSFRAVPLMRASTPAKTFLSLREALEYAHKATRAFRTAYAVWDVSGGRVRLVKTFRVEPTRA